MEMAIVLVTISLSMITFALISYQSSNFSMTAPKVFILFPAVMGTVSLCIFLRRIAFILFGKLHTQSIAKKNNSFCEHS